MVNLLIAMFNETYKEVTAKADSEWKMTRVQRVKSYTKQYPFPPPANVPFLLLALSWHLLKLLSARCTRRLGWLGSSTGFGGSATPAREESTQHGGPGGGAQENELSAQQAAVVERAACDLYLQAERHNKEEKGGSVEGKVDHLLE